MKQIFIALFLSFLCINCKTNENITVIDADFSSKTLLSKTEGTIDIDSMLPLKFEGLYPSCDKIVLEGKTPLIFDKKRNMILSADLRNRKLTSIISYIGSAKNEYLKITDFAVDNFSNIYIYDSDSRKINVYTPEGEYLRSLKVVCGSSIVISDSKIFINCSSLEESQIAVYDINGKLLYNITPDSKPSRYTLDNIGSITMFNGNIIYTNPFNNNIYSVTDKQSESLVQIDCGGELFDNNQLEGLNYKEFQNVLYKNYNKIMNFDHLSTYDNFIMLSTDRKDQLLIDIKKNKALVLSNMEPPYNILWSSIITMNNHGQLCTFVDNQNIVDAFLPWIKANQMAKPWMKNVLAYNGESNDNVVWLVMGHVKK